MTYSVRANLVKTSSNLRVDWMIGVFPISLLNLSEVVSELLLPLDASVQLLRDLETPLLHLVSLALPQCEELISHTKVGRFHVRLDLSVEVADVTDYM